MDDKKDKNAGSLAEIAQDVEVKLTEAILRWKYRRQGETPPADARLKEQSRGIKDQVHEILLRRGKNILKEFKSNPEKK